MEAWEIQALEPMTGFLPLLPGLMIFPALEQRLDPLRDTIPPFRGSGLSSALSSRESINSPKANRSSGLRVQPEILSESGINGFAFHCQNAEHAFVHTIQRLALSESMKCFEPQRKLT